jgi:hypothetical protein
VPIQVTCPSCNATLKTAESSAGKKAKCPKCAGVIQIPELAAPLDEYELESEPDARGAFSDDELASGPPVAQDRRPCPACGELIPKKAIKCRFCGEILDHSMRGVIGSASGAGDVSDPGWFKVRAGLSLLYNCIIIMFITAIVMVIGAMITGGMDVANQGGDDPPVVMLILLVIGGLVILGAAIGAIVGQVKCTNVPQSSGAHGYAVGAVVCMVVNILLGMVGGAAQMEALSGLGSLVSMVGYVLFILFIRRSAAYLNDHDLASSAGKFLIFGMVMFVLAMVMGVLAAIQQAPAIMAIIGLIVIVGGLAAFIWYMRLIKSLITTIGERTGLR